MKKKQLFLIYLLVFLAVIPLLSSFMFSYVEATGTSSTGTSKLPTPVAGTSSVSHEVAGNPTTFETEWNCSVGLSGFVLSNNQTGSWANSTWTAFSGSPTLAWSNKTITLTSTLNALVQWKIYCNNTDNAWGSTGIQSFRTVSVEVAPLSGFDVPSPNGTASIHGYIYGSDGWLYGCTREYGNYPGSIIRVNPNNYSQYSTRQIGEPCNGATALFDLLEAQGYIWTVDEYGNLYAVNMSASLTVIRSVRILDNSVGPYGALSAQCLCYNSSSGGIIYAAGMLDIAKYFIANGTHVQVNIAGSYKTFADFHSIQQSGGFLYIDGICPGAMESEWYKVWASNLSICSASAVVNGVMTDTSSQNSAFVFNGIESGSVLGVCACNKTSLAITVLDPAGEGGCFCTFITYQSQQVLVALDYQHNEIWVFAANNTLNLLRVVQIVNYSTAGNLLYGIWYGINKVARENNQYLDLTEWSPTRLIKINATTVFGALTHDVAVTNVVSSKTIVGKGCSMNISVTATNPGDYTETFNVTVYANTTAIATQTVTLTSGNSTTITFTWNTAGFSYGNYTISAYAWPVPNETNTADNTYTGGRVLVTIPGDVIGDRYVDGLDITVIGSCLFTSPGDKNWNPNCDIMNTGFIGGIDITIVGQHLFQSW